MKVLVVDIGGNNVKLYPPVRGRVRAEPVNLGAGWIERLPAGARAGSNDNARRGGVRLWKEAGSAGPSPRRSPR